MVSVSEIPLGQRTWHDLHTVHSQKVVLPSTSSSMPSRIICQSWLGVWSMAYAVGHVELHVPHCMQEISFSHSGATLWAKEGSKVDESIGA
jgi:hypothetical protein